VVVFEESDVDDTMMQDAAGYLFVDELLAHGIGGKGHTTIFLLAWLELVWPVWLECAKSDDVWLIVSCSTTVPCMYSTAQKPPKSNDICTPILGYNPRLWTRSYCLPSIIYTIILSSLHRAPFKVEATFGWYADSFVYIAHLACDSVRQANMS
jgi:hypothetical protein